MFTPDEACVALHMSHQPLPLETIVARAAAEFPAEQSARLLDSMLQKGAIGWKEQGGIGHWFLLPLVIGMYEGQDGELTADFLADVDAYTKSVSFRIFVSGRQPSADADDPDQPEHSGGARRRHL